MPHPAPQLLGCHAFLCRCTFVCEAQEPAWLHPSGALIPGTETLASMRREGVSVLQDFPAT